MAKKKKCSFCAINVHGHLSHCKVQGCPIIKSQIDGTDFKGAISGQAWEFKGLEKKLYVINTLDNVPAPPVTVPYQWPHNVDNGEAIDMRNLMC